MGLLSCSDDVILLNRELKEITEFAPITALLVEILLISTSRHIRRMYYPMCFLAHAFSDGNGGFNEGILKRFNVSSHGGYHVYKLSCRNKWTTAGNMNDAQAAKIAFNIRDIF